MELTKDTLLSIIKELMENNKGRYFREAQLQFDLAWALRERFINDNIKIHLEYFAKNNINDNYMYYDIVVEEDNKYIPIELKFKTKSIKGLDYTNQGAQDLGRYDFWKDVARVENFKDNTEKEMTKGYAIFITNDDAYKNNKGENTIYKDFAINENRETRKNQNLAWSSKSSDLKSTVGKNRLDSIKIEGDYFIQWGDIYNISDRYKFRALILEIK